MHIRVSTRDLIDYLIKLRIIIKEKDFINNFFRNSLENVNKSAKETLIGKLHYFSFSVVILKVLCMFNSTLLSIGFPALKPSLLIELCWLNSTWYYSAWNNFAPNVVILFCKKLQAFLKKSLWYRCFPVIFAKI